MVHAHKENVMMRTLAAVGAGICLLAAPLSAQHIEASVSGGYTASEGVSVDDRDLLGQVYNDLEVTSGGSFNVTFGVFASPQVLLEFMYNRQSSKLRAQGLGVKTDISELSVDGYHGNFVYNWGAEDSRIRPFAFAGVGATNYSFGDLLIPGAPAGKIPGDTRFSTTWGAGVKLYPTKNIGFRATIQWTPTYIKSTDVGYWCDPFYGCWVAGDPDYSHQFDTSGGVTFRF
jgi:opacity protein-like surface antigen